MGDVVHADRALARRILAGDERAFEALFDEFFPRLYRYAVAHLNGDKEAARDVVQETFRKAIERLDTYRGEAALYGWFCRICHNVLVDHCRARSRMGTTFTTIEDHGEIRAVLDALSAPVSTQPEDRATHRDVRRLVQAALDHLPPRYGDALAWKYVEGLSVREIAGRLKLSAKATESLLTRARNAFRDSITAIGSAAGIDGGRAGG
jgi:RNA polymerase sigma-70 factor (ECF subfamily)